MRRAERRSRDSLRLLFAVLVLLTAGRALAQEVSLSIPEGVLPPLIPEDNPLTAAKIELGKQLYFDARLSKDDTVSCATCHDPRSAFADPRGKATSAGVGGKLGPRNSPTVLNAAFLAQQFWDGRAVSLEDQALRPMVDPVEMAMPDHAAIVAKLKGFPEYASPFEAAFGSPEITIDRVAQAIASFERTLITLSSPFDRFQAGDPKAISESARRGWDLFNGKARCNTCHGFVGAFPLFTDEEYRNIGAGVTHPAFLALARKVDADPNVVDSLANEPGFKELGRVIVTKQRAHIGAFKTPQLRNVEHTAPYMHDGSEATLADVIEFYDRGGNPNPWLDGTMRPLALTAQEKADLVELMKTFSSDDLGRFAELGKLVK
jgi:cytochrome c peroxidase